MLGPDHPDLARSLNNLATVHARTGKYAEAMALHERALAIQERALGPDHADVAASLDLLASVHEATGGYAEAKVFAERALAAWERALGPDHPDLAYPLATLTTVVLAEHRAADAVALAGRAVDILEKHDTLAVRLAQTRFVLAHALWDAPQGGGRDRERATALARQALDVLRAEKGQDRPIAEIEAFLKRAGEN